MQFADDISDEAPIQFLESKEAKATKKLTKIEKEKAGKDEWKDALARMMMSTGASIHGERSIPHEDAE